MVSRVLGQMADFLRSRQGSDRACLQKKQTTNGTAQRKVVSGITPGDENTYSDNNFLSGKSTQRGFVE